MSQYIQQPELRYRLHRRKRKAYASHVISHSQLKLLSIRDLTRRMDWAASIDLLSSISTANRHWAVATFDPEVHQAAWAKALLPLTTAKP